VVDDAPSVREAVATLLILAGYDVTTAEDGFGALLQLRKMLPDVIVSDLDMPKMSGYELLSVVRRRFPQISTVAMSGAYQGCDVPLGVVADTLCDADMCGVPASISGDSSRRNHWTST
jgi:CheY-like chemotaxis protein